VLSIGLYVALAVAVFAVALLAVARPVPPSALALLVISVGQVIASLGAAPTRLRSVRAGQPIGPDGQPDAPRPLGSTAWYYGLSALLMALAVVEVGVGLAALRLEAPVGFLLAVAAGLAAFTAVLGALAAANLTKATSRRR
jgi:hypothetical protein